MPTIKLKIKCQSCGGTGLYSGMAESKDTAVVCSGCDGSGCADYEFTYEEFTERKRRPGIKHVYETNPGIKVGGPTPEKYGGMSYAKWLTGTKFTRGMENRECVCPAWWYQSADYNMKPDWRTGEVQCQMIGSFSTCKFFKVKEKCWKRFDAENPNYRKP